MTRGESAPPPLAPESWGTLFVHVEAKTMPEGLGVAWFPSVHAGGAADS
jgi:hypothetical protein